MSVKIILVNGPPRSGKDTIGSLLCQRLPFKLDKFARKLKEAAHALYGMSELPHDHFEDRKDTPLPEFFGKSPREIYIAVSETYFKPLHGERIFGEMLLVDLKQEAGPFVLTDSGFVPEAEVLIEHYGTSDCLLIRVHRPGHTFLGDSRNYIELPIQSIDVANDGTIDDLDMKLAALKLEVE